jgi:hypothetical protein
LEEEDEEEDEDEPEARVAFCCCECDEPRQTMGSTIEAARAEQPSAA